LGRFWIRPLLNWVSKPDFRELFMPLLIDCVGIRFLNGVGRAAALHWDFLAGGNPLQTVPYKHAIGIRLGILSKGFYLTNFLWRLGATINFNLIFEIVYYCRANHFGSSH